MYEENDYDNWQRKEAENRAPWSNVSIMMCRKVKGGRMRLALTQTAIKSYYERQRTNIYKI